MSQSSETNRAVQAWATPEWWTISLFSNVRPFEVLANADRWEIADYRLSPASLSLVRGTTIASYFLLLDTRAM
jgi:hypothetical protein